MHWHFFRLRTLIYLFKLVICISGDLSNACTGQYFPTRKWKWKSDRKWCPKLSHISYLRLISFALFLHILTTLLFRTCICMIAQREKKVGDICFKRRIVWTLPKSTETHVDVLCLLLFEQMLRKRQVKTMERDETNTGKKEWKICEYNGLRLKWCRRKKTEWYGSVEQKCPNVRIKHKCSSSSLQRTREKKEFKLKSTGKSGMRLRLPNERKMDSVLRKYTEKLLLSVQSISDGVLPNRFGRSVWVP